MTGSITCLIGIALQDFFEPLYLKDKPRRIVDTRTEEQQKYPELFKHVKW